jgi:starvation-inducible DNA-binding protein
MPKPAGADGASGKLAAELQAVLVDLIGLSLQTKQAHWNVRGPLFRPLHELFDEMTDAVRGWYDEVAERNRALRVPADGRPSAVAAAGRVEDLPAGEIPDREAAALVQKQVESLASRIRAGLGWIGEEDPVTQDLLIGIVQGLEKQAWMLRAHQA